ncbi:MAG TPA: hypothetical protein VH661_04850 [Candidatus Dormibacteraeota bacterium]|nr:hypothetical protein [Candidatus Dormibacteraeota bacterium]
MTEGERPDGDSEIAAPDDQAGTSTAVVEPVAGPDEGAEDEPLASVAGDNVARTGGRQRPSNTVVLLGVVLVVVIAQAVISWLSFDVTRQLRDQSAIANGLQRCIIQAQLNENASTDTSGATYKAAVQSCLNR